MILITSKCWISESWSPSLWCSFSNAAAPSTAAPQLRGPRVRLEKWTRGRESSSRRIEHSTPAAEQAAAPSVNRTQLRMWNESLLIRRCPLSKHFSSSLSAYHILFWYVVTMIYAITFNIEVTVTVLFPRCNSSFRTFALLFRSIIIPFSSI